MPPSLRPLLTILLFAREIVRTTKAFRIDETRSVFLSLGVREIVDSTHCFRKSRLISNLSFQREDFLLWLRTTCFFLIDIAPPQTEVPQIVLQRFSDSTSKHVPANSTVHQTSTQLSSPSQLSTTAQQELSNDHQTLRSQPPRSQNRNVNSRCATIMI